jgi:hypothetical protein
MRPEDLDVAHLRAMVEQAHADVRRVESVTPALTVGAVVGCLPLLLVLIAVVLLPILGG